MNTIFYYKRQARKFKYVNRLHSSIFILLLLFAILQVDTKPRCPDDPESYKCPCYKLEDGLFLECSSTTVNEIQYILEGITGPIQSFSIYELDEKVEILKTNFIPGGSCIKNFHISQTSVKDIEDETFLPLRECLETLSIVNSEIEFIPQRAFSGLAKIISLDLESNHISELPNYTFFGLPLIKLNIKGNEIKVIAESAFASLENTLSELDLRENLLKELPLSALSILQHLRSLRLSWNELSQFPPVNQWALETLEYLDLSSNNFIIIPEDCFLWCPSIKTLSLHFNSIESVHKHAFDTLKYLESVDLSRNRIKFMHRNIFINNKNLRSVDLSHNHIHHIHGMFSNLPSLVELLLSYNNILEVPIDAFTNSTFVSVIYLDNNSIRSLHVDCLSSQYRLSQLYLGFNFIDDVPQKLFTNKSQLVSVSLDNNLISNLAPSSFEDLDSLIEIRLQCNKLSIIPANLFNGKVFLQEIHLQNNTIKVIENKAFNDLTQLRYLNLQKNDLNSTMDFLPRAPSSLMSLYIDSNKIKTLGKLFLKDQNHLETLLLRNNAISGINNSIFQNLKETVRLHLQQNRIKKIEDNTFISMIALKVLDISDNFIGSINSLAFVGLAELEELNLSGNHIANIAINSFIELKKIRVIDLSNNFLKIIHNSVFLPGLPLRSLNLHNNTIREIEDNAFVGLNNLNTLSLHNNELLPKHVKKINVQGLKSLLLSHNNLSTLEFDTFKQFPLLEYLYLDSCDINSFSSKYLDTNKKIVKLSLANNPLTFLDNNVFKENDMIIELDLSKSLFFIFPYESIHNTKYLSHLNIDENFIDTLNFNRLQNLTELKSLNIRRNELKSVVVFEETTIPELTYLDLSMNLLNNLPNNFINAFPNLHKLNVSKNNIYSFQPFLIFNKYHEQLIYMDIGNNPLKFMSSNEIRDNMKGIICELHISGTKLTIITNDTFNFFPKLQYLFIKSNSINTLLKSPFQSLSLLQTVDLSHNRLSILQTENFYGLHKLTTLNLSHNVIQHLERFSQDLKSLNSLDLSHNKITKISNNCFNKLVELTELVLQGNQIKVLSDDTFKNNNKLKTLNLMNNLIEAYFPKMLISIELHIRNILIQGNPLDCNCDMHESWSWVQDHKRIFQNSPGYCNKPISSKGEPITELDLTAVCEIPTIYELEVEGKTIESLSISWQVRNDTGIKGLRVAFYAEDDVAKMKFKTLSKDLSTTDIDDLEPIKDYVICITALYSEEEFDETYLGVTLDYSDFFNSTFDFNSSALFNASTSECLSYGTSNRAYTIKPLPTFYPSIDAILTRRLGLIVGCCMGVVTFIILVSVLGYMKSTKKRMIPDPDQNGSEFNEMPSSMHSRDDILKSMHNNTSTDNILLGISKN